MAIEIVNFPLKMVIFTAILSPLSVLGMAIGNRGVKRSGSG